MANPFAFTNGDTKGGVPDPLASPASDYLAADGSWKPAAGGLISIQGEAGDGSLTPVLTGAILLTAGTDSEAFPTPGFNIVNPAPGQLRVRIDPFSSGNLGVVKDPGGAPARNYLGADNTFRPLATLTPGVFLSQNCASGAFTVLKTLGPGLTAGNYLVFGNGECGAIAALGLVISTIKLNGAEVMRAADALTGAAAVGPARPMSVPLFAITALDVITFELFQTTGLVITCGGGTSQLSLVQIG